MSAFSPQSQSRRTVAVFDSYADAQRAVDRLSDERFPVERVAIVGQGLKYVERVVGRLTTARAAAMGAANGALLGAFLGLLAGLIFTLHPNPVLSLLVLYGLVIGGVLGAVIGALMHLATAGQRDFISVRSMEADRYEITVDEDVADQAAAILHVFGATPQQPAPASPPRSTTGSPATT